MTHQTSASPIVSSRMSKIPARVIIIAAIFVVAGGAYSVERYRISGALRNAEVFVLAGEHKEAEKTLEWCYGGIRILSRCVWRLQKRLSRMRTQKEEIARLRRGRERRLRICRRGSMTRHSTACLEKRMLRKRDIKQRSPILRNRSPLIRTIRKRFSASLKRLMNWAIMIRHFPCAQERKLSSPMTLREMLQALSTPNLPPSLLSEESMTKRRLCLKSGGKRGWKRRSLCRSRRFCAVGTR